MFVHFPPAEPDANDHTLLVADGKAFAKLKIVSQMQKRTVFLTEHTLVFVTQGAKLLHFGEETVKAESGQIILLKKGIYVMAEYIENKDFEAILIFLTPKSIRDAITATGLSVHLSSAKDTPYLVLNSNPYLMDYIVSFRKYFDASQLRNPQFLKLKQVEILMLLINANTSKEFQKFLIDLARNQPESIEFIINEYLLQPLSIADYANLSNRSLSAFKRDFKHTFNMAPRQWITQKRLEHAHLLLINTNDRISEISDRCGFESTSYFIKLFKAQYGHTPQILRAKSLIN